MSRKAVIRRVLAAAAVLLAVVACFAQVQDGDTPALMLHLPDYDQAVKNAGYATGSQALKHYLGQRPELDLIDFAGGTEAVTAPYTAGKLLIVEYSTPEAAADADAKFREVASGRSDMLYRRIGNYAAIVFDVTDAAAANALLDQVHYEKDVQWLGDPPAKPTRGVSVPQMASVLFSSVLWLVGCGVVALAGGGIAGWLYWRRVKQRRAAMSTFTDAGGITRLNLDGLTPEILPEKLLGE
jgi:hypothetical protein